MSTEFSFIWNTVSSNQTDPFGKDKEFYFTSYCINAKPPIHIFITCTQPVLEPKRLKIKLSEKTADGITVKRQQKLCMLTVGVQSMILTEVKHKILFCEIEEVTFPSSELLKKCQPGKISDDLKRLLSDDETKDITFKFNKNQELKAHRLMLRMRSSVFSNMLDTDMIERKSGVVEIDDITFECFEALLQFIYTDTCVNVKHFTEELLYAAEKYELIGLKYKAAMSMLESINSSNAVETAILLHRYQLPDFWREAMTFVNANKGEVLKTIDRKEPDIVKEFHRMMSLSL